MVIATPIQPSTGLRPIIKLVGRSTNEIIKNLVRVGRADIACTLLLDRIEIDKVSLADCCDPVLKDLTQNEQFRSFLPYAKTLIIKCNSLGIELDVRAINRAIVKLRSESIKDSNELLINSLDAGYDIDKRTIEHSIIEIRELDPLASCKLILKAREKNHFIDPRIINITLDRLHQTNAEAALQLAHQLIDDKQPIDSRTFDRTIISLNKENKNKEACELLLKLLDRGDFNPHLKTIEIASIISRKENPVLVGNLTLKCIEKGILLDHSIIENTVVVIRDVDPILAGNLLLKAFDLKAKNYDFSHETVGITIEKLDIDLASQLLLKALNRKYRIYPDIVQGTILKAINSDSKEIALTLLQKAFENGYKICLDK